MTWWTHKGWNITVHVSLMSLFIPRSGIYEQGSTDRDPRTDISVRITPRFPKSFGYWSDRPKFITDPGPVWTVRSKISRTRSLDPWRTELFWTISTHHWYMHVHSIVSIFFCSEHGLSLIKSDDKFRSGHLNDKNVSIQPYWIGLTASAGITVL